MARHEVAWSARRQAKPEAVEIVVKCLGKFPDPFNGLDEAFWDQLQKLQLDGQFFELCASHFPTFCALLYHLIHKSGRHTTFVFNRTQRLLWAQMLKMLRAGVPLFIIVLKARQLGVSTLFAAWVFWHCWRAQHVKCVTIAHETSLSDHIIGMLRVGYDNLPQLPLWRPTPRQKHALTLPRTEMFFADRDSGNETRVATTFEARGTTKKIIWESEKAFYKDADKLDRALMPQLPTRGTPARALSSFLRESTPNGMNHFYEEYINAQHAYEVQSEFGKNEGVEDVAVFYPWQLHDEPWCEGYQSPVGKGFKLTPDEKKKQEKFSRIRAAYDGHEVSLEQMNWYRQTLDQYPYFGDEEYFEMDYPSTDRSCWLLSSDNAFRHVMPFLGKCVDDATDRSRAAWAKVPV